VKKLILIFLLALLPFQFSWAAAAVYCQHEDEPASMHLGHHSHKHDAKSDASEEADNQLAAHGDCGYCQLSSQSPFAVTMQDIVARIAWSGTSIPTLSFSSHIPDGPHEPDWRLAA
jgi:hypothetical protein